MSVRTQLNQVDSGKQFRQFLISEDLSKSTKPWWHYPTKNKPDPELIEIAFELVIKKDQIVKSTTEIDFILKANFSRHQLNSIQPIIYDLFINQGPLTKLYFDHEVTDIYVDSFDRISCLRKGILQETPFKFYSEKQYLWFYNRYLALASIECNTSEPLKSGIIKDQWNSRINVVHESIRNNTFPSMVLRIPRIKEISFEMLVAERVLPPSLALWLTELIGIGKVNILVSGVSGTGKTTFTSALLSSIPKTERICLIEDIPELSIDRSNIDCLIPSNKEISLADLVKATLNRSPHRIILGEIRDKEGNIFLKALETGHVGSVATIHAQSSLDALDRLADLVNEYSNIDISENIIIKKIQKNIHIVIQMFREEGTPCLLEIVEVVRDTNIKILPLVSYTGRRNGKRHWHLHSNNLRSSKHYLALTLSGTTLVAGHYLSE
jgi:pilus assembly protein CpaF